MVPLFAQAVVRWLRSGGICERIQRSPCAQALCGQAWSLINQSAQGVEDLKAGPQATRGFLGGPVVWCGELVTLEDHAHSGVSRDHFNVAEFFSVLVVSGSARCRAKAFLALNQVKLSIVCTKVRREQARPRHLLSALTDAGVLGGCTCRFPFPHVAVVCGGCGVHQCVLLFDAGGSERSVQYPDGIRFVVHLTDVS